jgi:hypothetical protein
MVFAFGRSFTLPSRKHENRNQPEDPSALSRGGPVDRGHHLAIPELVPKGLPGLRGGVGLHFHGHLLGYSEWRIKGEGQPLPVRTIPLR